MKLPGPAHKYGYTYDQVEQIMGDRIEEFNQWMRGQTMMLDEELGTIIYEDDVRRFLRGSPVID